MLLMLLKNKIEKKRKEKATERKRKTTQISKKGNEASELKASPLIDGAGVGSSLFAHNA